MRCYLTVMSTTIFYFNIKFVHKHWRVTLNQNKENYFQSNISLFFGKCYGFLCRLICKKKFLFLFFRQFSLFTSNRSCCTCFIELFGKHNPICILQKFIVVNRSDLIVSHLVCTPPVGKNVKQVLEGQLRHPYL